MLSKQKYNKNHTMKENGIMIAIYPTIGVLLLNSNIQNFIILPFFIFQFLQSGYNKNAIKQ